MADCANYGDNASYSDTQIMQIMKIIQNMHIMQIMHFIQIICSTPKEATRVSRRCQWATTLPSIPHICHLFYTTAIWGVEILHLKVRRFETKVASRKNSVNFHPRTQIMSCVKIMICMLNCESNYTLYKIACVRLHNL